MMRRLLATLLLAVPGWCLAAAPDRGLVGYWNFDEVSGVVVHDRSGLGNDGTLFGEPQQVRGRVGRGMAFGPHDYVEVAAHPRLDFRQRFSIEFWIKPAPQAAQAQFLAKGPLEQGWDLWYDPPGKLNIGWFPWWLAGEVYGKHLLSITFAARARISGAPGLPSNMPYFRFAARYGKLLYDERVRRAPDWRRRIQVEPSEVWWENYVYEHDCSNGEQLIVHLVNPPATERVVIDGKQAPEPRKDLLVHLTPPAGRRPAAVYVLSPDLEPYCRKLTCEPQGQELRVRIPELKYWDLLVLVF
jgi:hypothetical protein